MFVVVDDRADVVGAYVSAFEGEGVVAIGFGQDDFLGWLNAASTDDLEAVHCFVLGEFGRRTSCPDLIHAKVNAAVVGLAEVRSLDTTLELFSAGIDDVIRKPVHIREIMARANAIWRRICGLQRQQPSRLKVFFDGRDPEVDGTPLALPRRERRIFEFLVKNGHRRMTKTQIFSAVYGIFEENVDEVVVEGHISKLRRKLRLQLGQDVIDAKRYLGYQFVGQRFLEGAQPAVKTLPAAATGADDSASASAFAWTSPEPVAA
jgi:DNA-binding response OmpR family regulator